MKFTIFFVWALSLFEITTCAWEKGVKSSCDGVKEVTEKFPEPTSKIGETIWAAYYTQIENLKVLTTSNYEILASNSVSMLEALSLLAKVSRTPRNLLYQLDKVYPAKTAAYCNIVTNLKGIIGVLSARINDTIEMVAKSITSCLDQYNSRFSQWEEDRCENIDFKQMVNAARFNTNTIAFIAETALNGTFADEAFEAFTIASLVSNLLLLSVHGTNANMGSVLDSEWCDISPFLKSCFDAMDPIVADTTKLISKASFASVPAMRDYLRNFVEIIYSYNPSLQTLLGPFELKVTKEEVNNSLKKSAQQ